MDWDKPETDDPETDSEITGLRCIRIAVVKLGPMSSHIYEGFYNMLADIDSVKLAEIAGLRTPQFTDASKYTLNLGWGELKLKLIHNTTQSGWRNIVASKKIQAVIAVVHARRNSTDEQLESVMKQYQLLQSTYQQARCLFIDPNEKQGNNSQDDRTSTFIRYIPLAPESSLRRMLLAMTHELLLNIVHGLHQFVNLPDNHKSLLFSTPVDSTIQVKRTLLGVGLGLKSNDSTPPTPTTPDTPGSSPPPPVQPVTSAPAAVYKVQKNIGDICLMLSDFKGACQYFKFAASQAEKVGDQLWNAAATEGIACSVYLQRMSLAATHDSEFTSDAAWISEVTSLYNDAIQNYEHTSIPLRIEAGIRLSSFLIKFSRDGTLIQESIFDTYGKCKLLTSSNTPQIITKLSELSIYAGFDRKATLLLRLAGQVSAMQGKPEQALKQYLSAASLLSMPLRLNPCTAELEVIKKDSAGIELHKPDILQFALLKEMLSAAKTLSERNPQRCAYYYQLSLFAVSNYHTIVDQSFMYKVFRVLSDYEGSHGCGFKALSPPLPTVPIQPLESPDHHRPVLKTVRVGKQIFSVNHHINPESLQHPVWVAQTTAKVNITLCNPLGIPLTFQRVGVQLESGSVPSRVIWRENVSLASKATGVFTVGIHPLQGGKVTIENVIVYVLANGIVLHPWVLPISCQKDLSPTVHVVSSIPLLSIAPKGSTDHKVEMSLITGQVQPLTFCLQNIGMHSISLLKLSPTELDDNSGQNLITYLSLSCLESAINDILPLGPGTTKELTVYFTAPAMLLSGSKNLQFNLDVLYGKEESEQQLVSTTNIRNLEGHWETYALCQRRASLPCNVEISDGVSCSSSSYSECNRFITASITNHISSQGTGRKQLSIYVANSPYKLIRPHEDAELFSIPSSLAVSADFTDCPIGLQPACHKILLPEGVSVTVLIPTLQLIQNSDRSQFPLEKLSLRWEGQLQSANERIFGRIPLKIVPEIRDSQPLTSVPKIRFCFKEPNAPQEEVKSADYPLDGETVSVGLVVDDEEMLISRSTFINQEESEVTLHGFHDLTIKLLSEDSSRSSRPLSIKIGFTQKGIRANTFHAACLGETVSYEGSISADLLPDGDDGHPITISLHSPGITLLQVMVITDEATHTHTFPIRCVNKRLSSFNK